MHRCAGRSTPRHRRGARIEDTACTFGGDDLSRLFITTSQENVETSADPLAGALFIADVGARGLPVREFAG